MLETIWFILWGLLWAVYFMLDGFDLGLGAMLPFLGKNEDERRIIYNVSGPFWDGNEVWLIAAGGVTFAAFPKAYATLFSALYTPLLLLLFCLILRAVSYEFRNKVDSAGWRSLWDGVHFVTNLAPCVLLGVAFANLFMGIPVDAKGVYHGSLPALLNPYGLAGGVLFLVIFMMHGAIWLAAKSEGTLQTRALAVTLLLWPITLLCLLVFLGMTWAYTSLFANYLAMPLLCLIPLLVVVALVGVRVMLGKGCVWTAWFCSCAFIVMVTFFGIAGMFPGMVISSLDPAATLTAMNAASTSLTLTIMLVVALVMVPIVLLYQFWMYRVFSAPVTARDLNNENAY